MRRHPFDPVSAVLGVLAVAAGVFVLADPTGDVDARGTAWLAVTAALVGLALIPWGRFRRHPVPVAEAAAGDAADAMHRTDRIDSTDSTDSTDRAGGAVS